MTNTHTYNLFFCRTDVRTYDISELYQFADQTGILERHRQMLSQPFQDSQVLSFSCKTKHIGLIVHSGCEQKCQSAKVHLSTFILFAAVDCLVILTFPHCHFIRDLAFFQNIYVITVE